MGKVAKAVVGIGLIVATGGIASGIIGSIYGAVSVTSSVYMLTTGLITLVGASLIGSALTPDIPDIEGTDAYSGVALQTRKNNTNAVPEIYGEKRVGSNIIWEDTTGSQNNDYWAIQVIADGEIESYLELYAGETTMTDRGSDVYTTDYAQAVVYTTSGASGMNVSAVTFCNTSAGGTVTGSSQGLSGTIPANVAFIAVHQEFKSADNKHTQLDSITAKVQGEKIKTVTASGYDSEVYSNNPAEIVAHLMEESLNIQDSDIDFTSFYNARTLCNTYGYTCNISFVNQRNIQSVIQDVLGTFRGQVVYSQGKWKLKLDEKNATVAKALDEDDILNRSLNISMKGFSDIANKVTVKYINPTDNWLSAKVEIEDTSLQTLDGQTLEKTLDIKGVTSSTQANKLAEITLNTMRYSEDVSGNRIKQTPLAISFATTVKNAELEVGDIISLDHSLLDRVRKFVILSVESDQSGAISLACREYCNTHFKDSSNNDII